jgi:hypothetical protein
VIETGTSWATDCGVRSRVGLATTDITGGGARGLIVQWPPITSSVIEAVDTCEFINRFRIGLGILDLNAATRKRGRTSCDTSKEER